ncbi:MAG: hypothetical protein P8106_09595 [Gammaproteobacteria bacterium]
MKRSRRTLRMGCGEPLAGRPLAPAGREPPAHRSAGAPAHPPRKEKDQ